MTEAVGRRERKKEATRRRIFDAARALFGERGFDATTIDDITERADVAKATFFNYFPRKEALIEELADEWMAAAEATAAKSGAPVLTRLKALYAGLAAAFDQDRDLARAVMRSSAHRLCCPGTGGQWHHFDQRVIDLIAQGQAKAEIRSDVDAHVMHGVLVSCFVGGVLWWLGEVGNGHSPRRRPASLREVIADLQGVAMDGMKAKRAGR